MRFRVLGPLEVHDGGVAVDLSPKLRDLLAALLSNPNGPVTAAGLIHQLWADATPRTATKSLQAYIYRLRTALGAERIRSGPQGYALAVRPRELDAEQFAALVGRGRTAMKAGQPEQAAGLLQDGLGLWRGVAYDGQEHVPAASGESVRLNELRLAAFEERVQIDLTLGRHAELVGELRGMVVEHPFRERPRAELMLALYRLGRVTEALDVYREGRELLAGEFGLDPSPLLRNLEQAILVCDPALDLGWEQQPPGSAQRPMAGSAGRGA